VAVTEVGQTRSLNLREAGFVIGGTLCEIAG
jgi:hypothetical protein